MSTCGGWNGRTRGISPPRPLPPWRGATRPSWICPTLLRSTTDRHGLARKLDDLEKDARCDYGVWLGAHPSGVRSSRELARLSQQVCGIKLYCGHTTGGLTITPSQMERQVASWPGPGVLAAHAEGEMVGIFLASLARHRKRGHLCHIDTAGAVAEVAEHKSRGTKVTAGVCPHHLFFTDRDLPLLGPNGVMKPPLGTPSDQEALWNGDPEGRNRCCGVGSRPPHLG